MRVRRLAELLVVTILILALISVRDFKPAEAFSRLTTTLNSFPTSLAATFLP
ncbi:MAG: hypothetical protein ACO1OO_10345 [Flavisolibacter sp.]